MFDKYFEHGLRIVQVAKKGKNPIAHEWQNHYAKTPEQVEQWVEDGYNIGVILNARHSIIDVEIDSPEAEKAWNDLGLECYTPTFKGRRGAHRLFRVPDAYIDLLPAKTVVKPLGIEFRIGNAVGSNGLPLACQSVFPPSVHESGHQYQWLPECSLDDYDEFAELPSELFALLIDETTWETGVQVRGRGGHVHRADDYDLLRDGAGEGGRNNALWDYSHRKLHEYDLSQMDRDIQKILLEQLQKVNEEQCDPPLPKHEVKQVFDSSFAIAAKSQSQEREEFGIIDDDTPKTQKQFKLELEVKKLEKQIEIEREAEKQLADEKEQLEKDVQTLKESGLDHDELKKMETRHVNKIEGGRELLKKTRRLGAVDRELLEAHGKLKRKEVREETKKEELTASHQRNGAPEGTAGDYTFFSLIGLDVTKKTQHNRDWSLEIVDAVPPSYRLRIPALAEQLESRGGVVILTIDEIRSAPKVALAIQRDTGDVQVDTKPSIWKRVWCGGSNSVGVATQLMREAKKVKPTTAGQNRHVQAAIKVLDILRVAVSNEHVDTPSESGSPVWRKDGTLWFSWDYVWEKAAHRTTLTAKDGEELKAILLNCLGKERFGRASFTHERDGITIHYVIWKRGVEYKALVDLTEESEAIRSRSIDVAPSEDFSNEAGDQSSETETS